MINRLLLNLCGVVGIVAAIAAPAITTPAMAADDIAAKAQACAACHGENGVPTDPKTMPIIWGQQANYLYKELHDYKSGDRKSPIMAPVVADISLPDLRQLANYFAAKPWPPKQGSGAAGAPPNGIAQCQPCHQPNFEGGAPAPRLAGLKLRIPGRRDEKFCRRRPHQQRRHAGLHESVVRRRSRRHGEISRRAVIV